MKISQRYLNLQARISKGNQGPRYSSFATKNWSKKFVRLASSRMAVWQFLMPCENKLKHNAVVSRGIIIKHLSALLNLSWPKLNCQGYKAVNSSTLYLELGPNNFVNILLKIGIFAKQLISDCLYCFLPEQNEMFANFFAKIRKPTHFRFRSIFCANYN